MSQSQKSERMKFNWRWFLKLAGGLTIFTCVAWVVSFSPAVGLPLYNWLLFHPWKGNDGNYRHGVADGIKPQDAYFTAPDGKKLHGWLYKSPNERRIIMYSHGNGGNLEIRVAVSAMLLRTGSSVFVYDYEGYGRSEGEPSMDNICEDGSAAYDYLTKSLHYAPSRIVLFGESLGTVVTGDVASHVQCAGVILECPLYSALRRANELLPITKIYPDWMWPHKGLDNSHVFVKAHSPLLLVSGTKDDVVPISHADDLYAISCQPKSYVRIEGAGHGDRVMMQSPEYQKELRRFLSEI